MSELKNCPFCGGKPYLERSHRAFIKAQTTRVAFVRCTECDARTGRVELSKYGNTSHSAKAEEEAIKLWNQRQPMQNIVKLFEAEKSNLTTWAEDMAFKLGIDKAIEIVKEEGGLNG